METNSVSQQTTTLRKGIIDDNYGNEKFIKTSLSRLIKAIKMSLSSLKAIADRVLTNVKKDIDDFQNDFAEATMSLQGNVSEPETEPTPLISPIYSGNTLVQGMSKLAGFDVTQAQPVAANTENLASTVVDKPAISNVVDMDPNSPAIKPLEPVVKEPVLSSKFEVQNKENNSVEDFGIVPPAFSVGVVKEDNFQNEQLDYERKKEEASITSTITGVTANPDFQEKKEPEPVLQTPQDFNAEEEAKDRGMAYVDIIDGMIKVEEKHLLELRKFQEEIDSKFEIIKEKYQKDVEDLVRKTEMLREEKPSFAPIHEALDRQNEMLNSYNQGIRNVR